MHGDVKKGYPHSIPERKARHENRGRNVAYRGNSRGFCGWRIVGAKKGLSGPRET